jgi:hypothetical protein
MNKTTDRLTEIARTGWPYAAGGCATLLLIAEVMLRLFSAPSWPPVESAFDHGERNCFRPVPNSSVTYRRYGLLDEPVEHAVNELGFRGIVPDMALDLKIAIVGDDMVYGVGIPETETIPATLERTLRTRMPSARIKVINLGWPGFNIEEQSVEFRKISDRIKPDIVILMVGDRYSAPSACSGAALPVRTLIRTYSALWNAFEKGINGARFNTAVMFSVPAMEYPIEVMLGRFRSPGADVLLARMIRTPPVATETGAKVEFDQIARDAGLEILDMSDGVDTAGGTSSTVRNDRDLRPASIKAVSAEIADFIQPWIERRIQGSTRL